MRLQHATYKVKRYPKTISTYKRLRATPFFSKGVFLFFLERLCGEGDAKRNLSLERAVSSDEIFRFFIMGLLKFFIDL